MGSKNEGKKKKALILKRDRTIRLKVLVVGGGGGGNKKHLSALPTPPTALPPKTKQNKKATTSILCGRHCYNFSSVWTDFVFSFFFHHAA